MNTLPDSLHQLKEYIIDYSGSDQDLNQKVNAIEARVKSQIAEVKAKFGPQESVVEWCINSLGFPEELANNFVEFYWPQVEAARVEKQPRVSGSDRNAEVRAMIAEVKRSGGTKASVIEWAVSKFRCNKVMMRTFVNVNWDNVSTEEQVKS